MTDTLARPTVGTSAPPEWFEDYSEGMRFSSPSRVVSDDDVRAYVRFSNDVRSVLGQSAPGPLPIPRLYLFCLGVGLLLHAGGGYIPTGFVAFSGFDEITYVRTASGGDAIRSTAVVTELIPRNTTGMVVYRQQTTTPDDEVLTSSVQRILVRRMPADV